MRKREIVVKTFIFLSLLCLCANAWPAESRIPELKGQLSALEGQKTEFEAEREKLIAEGNELSLKIEALKIQSRGGLGIIGRYRLSRSLRKAQALAEKIQALEKNINELENRLKDKRSELGEEYKNQIAILLGKLDAASEAEEKREILEKLEEYQAAKEQLAKPEKRELGYLDLSKIEIREDDGPQEIREKADLINDSASKLNRGIEMLDVQMKRLQEEVETRKKLGEFAEEISFFGERISREQIADGASGESNAVLAEDSDAETTEIAAVKQLTEYL
jgi:chromosome segregation ATPase